MVNLNLRVLYFLRFLTVLTLIVVLLGAYTRLKDAGLGCPDWPGCYGEWVVPQQITSDNPHANLPLEKGKAWLEMIHRYAAGTLGLLIFAFTVMTWAGPVFLRKYRGLTSFLSVLVVLQALLGMWTVTWLLHPTIVMLHLLGGLLILSCVWLLRLRVKNAPILYIPSFPPSLYYATLLGLILLIMQIALGGWVSANYAALVCGTDFPLCQGKISPILHLKEALRFWIPIDQNYAGGVLDHPIRLTIHMLHRIGALILVTYWLILGTICLRRLEPHLIKLIGILFLLLTIQISLGIVNVVELLPTWSAILHNGVAALLLLNVVTINYYIYQGQHHERKI